MEAKCILGARLKYTSDFWVERQSGRHIGRLSVALGSVGGLRWRSGND